MQLTCPKCGQVIPGNDINVERGVGVCKACSEVVPIREPSGPEPKRPFEFSWDEDVRDGTFSVTHEGLPTNRVRRAVIAFVAVTPLLYAYIAFHLAGMLVCSIFVYTLLWAIFRRSTLTFRKGTLVVRTGPLWPQRERCVEGIVRFQQVEGAFAIGAKVADGSFVPLPVPFAGHLGQNQVDFALFRLNELLAETRAAAAVTGYRVANATPAEITDDSEASEAAHVREASHKQ